MKRITWLSLTFAGLLGVSLSASIVEAQHLLIPSAVNSDVKRYHATGGFFMDEFIAPRAGGLSAAYGLTYAYDGYILVASGLNDSILRYDPSGNFVNTLVPSGSGGLNAPFNIVQGPRYDILVSSRSNPNNTVKRYSARTGEYLGDFLNPYPSIGNLGDLTYGPDGNLYVASISSAMVQKYNGLTGDYLGDFVTARSGGLSNPWDMTFGPDGNLYITSGSTDSVKKYDGTTGAYLGDFVAANEGGLNVPTGLQFGPDGNLYVISSFTRQVKRYDGTTGTFIDDFVTDPTNVAPSFLVFQQVPEPGCVALLCGLSGVIIPLVMRRR